jgi:plastocyanin
MTRLLSSLAAVSTAGALALVAAGCGSDDDSSSDAAAPAATQAATTSSSGAAQKLTLAAAEDGGLSFTEKTLDAKAGSVTITMDNPSGDQMPHAIAIEGNGADQDGEVAQPGGTSTVTADLKPGTYTFYCPVGQHRQNGMEGTLTVQ